MPISVHKILKSTLKREFRWGEDMVDVGSHFIFLKIGSNKNKCIASLVIQPKDEKNSSKLSISLMTPRLIPKNKIIMLSQPELNFIELEPFKPKVVGEIEFKYREDFDINKDSEKYWLLIEILSIKMEEIEIQEIRKFHVTEYEKKEQPLNDLSKKLNQINQKIIDS